MRHFPTSAGQFHLAKILVVDVAKPDIWLESVAEKSGETVNKCAQLSKESGDNVSTVDYVVWRTLHSALTPPSSFSTGTPLHPD